MENYLFIGYLEHGKRIYMDEKKAFAIEIDGQILRCASPEELEECYKIFPHMRPAIVKSEWSEGFKACPDCGSTKFLEGPHGGLCINFKCADCGSEFNNMFPFGIERISKPGTLRQEKKEQEA